MKKEIESSRSSLTAYDLLRTRGMRRISICLIVVWSENTPALPSVYLCSFTCTQLLLFMNSATTNNNNIQTTIHHRVFENMTQRHCTPVYLYTCLPAYLATCTALHLSTCLPLHLSACTPVYLHTCIPGYLHTCLPAYLATCIAVHLSTCLPLYLSTCPPVHQQLSVFLCRFSTSFAYYGLAMDLQKFGVSHLISNKATFELTAADSFLYSSLT